MVKFQDHLNSQKHSRQVARSHSIGGITRLTRRQIATSQQKKKSYSTDRRENRRLNSCDLTDDFFERRNTKVFQNENISRDPCYRLRQVGEDLTSVSNISSMLNQRLTIQPYYSLPSCVEQDNIFRKEKNKPTCNKNVHLLNLSKEAEQYTAVGAENYDLCSNSVRTTDVCKASIFKDCREILAPLECNFSERQKLEKNKNIDSSLLEMTDIDTMNQNLDLSTESSDSTTDCFNNEDELFVSRQQHMFHDDFSECHLSLDSCIDGNTDRYEDNDSNTDRYGDNDAKTERYGDNDSNTDRYGDNDSNTDRYGDNDSNADRYGDNDSDTDRYGDNDSNTDRYGNNDAKTERYGDNDGNTDRYGDTDSTEIYCGNDIYVPVFGDDLTTDTTQQSPQSFGNTEREHEHDSGDFSECYSLRKQDTLVLSSDDEQDENEKYLNLFESLKNVLCQKLPDENNADNSMNDEDIIETKVPLHLNKYKNMLTNSEHFRCAICGSNLEIPSFQLFSDNFENCIFTSYRHRDYYMPVELYCPSCCCGRNIYLSH